MKLEIVSKSENFSKRQIQVQKYLIYLKKWT
jgi:hypothetical protein